MFISSCTNICFSVKTFFLSNVNTIFECLYMFIGWEKGHQLSAYVTGGGMVKVIQNAISVIEIHCPT